MDLPEFKTVECPHCGVDTKLSLKREQVELVYSGLCEGCEGFLVTAVDSKTNLFDYRFLKPEPGPMLAD